MTHWSIDVTDELLCLVPCTWAQQMLNSIVSLLDVAKMC